METLDSGDKPDEKTVKLIVKAAAAIAKDLMPKEEAK
jgi:hypothetical protein